MEQHSDSGQSDGGSGGGIIKLVAKSIVTVGIGSVISADGTSGEYKSNSRGGGGSGGAISITLLNQDRINADVSVVGNRQGGGAGILINQGIPVQASSALSISAVGGAGGALNSSTPAAGGGAGGKIVLRRGGTDAVTAPSPTIVKTLTAINRPFNASPQNANFNPSALQAGDLIKVTLDATNLGGVATVVKDELLTTKGITSGIKTCKYYFVDENTRPSDIPDESVRGILSWTISSDKTIYYFCKVQ
jgi:hypothetical protein